MERLFAPDADSGFPSQIGLIAHDPRLPSRAANKRAGSTDEPVRCA